MPDDNRLERTMELLEKARGLPVEERDPFLKEACGSDDQLHAEIVSLLKADSGDSHFMKEPLIGSTIPADSWIGKTLGNYRIIEALASGGMGVVYRAEQEQPRREVALKLIRGGPVSPHCCGVSSWKPRCWAGWTTPASPRSRGLGSRNRRCPALFRHGIDRRPAAHPVADERKLGKEERLELLIKVCDAVNHAHLKGVVHRDLKPANILVRKDGQPKVLDSA